MPCRAVPCRAVPCRSVPCRSVTCRTAARVPCYLRPDAARSLVIRRLIRPATERRRRRRWRQRYSARQQRQSVGPPRLCCVECFNLHCEAPTATRPVQLSVLRQCSPLPLPPPSGCSRRRFSHRRPCCLPPPPPPPQTGPRRPPSLPPRRETLPAGQLPSAVLVPAVTVTATVTVTVTVTAALAGGSTQQLGCCLSQPGRVSRPVRETLRNDFWVTTSDRSDQKQTPARLPNKDNGPARESRPNPPAQNHNRTCGWS